MAPLPVRVGITEQHWTPTEKAYSLERTVHSTPSYSSMNGGRNRMNTRMPIA